MPMNPAKSSGQSHLGMTLLTTVTSDEDKQVRFHRARANVIGAACAVPAGATLVN